MKFLRNFLASIMGTLVALGIFWFMFVIFISVLGSTEDPVSIRNNSVLELQFSEPIVDYVGTPSDAPFSSLFEESAGLDQILHAIRVAKNDSRIKGINIKTSSLLAGMAQTEEIREALLDFKSEGKFIYAYADFYGQKEYYLASVADEVFLNPQGIMDFKGLSSEVLFFKDFQEKTGVKMEVVRHGKYKSAVEPFLADRMSDENRLQIKSLIESLWGSMLEDVAETRGIDVSELNRIADELGGRTPELAVLNGLIDSLVYQDQYDARLRTELNIGEKARIPAVSLKNYMKYAKSKRLKKGKEQIALIYAQGQVGYGSGSPQVIGQGTINSALRRARNNDNIKAVVLRVNSPGGSALTSDLIWREVQLTREVKPVVVSFGDVAASGGYYIGVAGTKIFAEPTTITGSIGVFGTIPNFSEFAEEIGINAEQVGTNKNSVDYSIFEPMSNSFRAQVKEGVERTYDTFLSRVAEGRGMTVEEVDKIAQGRVWSGAEALEIGLVDELGSLEAAIEEAANLAEVSSYRVTKYPRFKSEFEQLMDDLGGAQSRMAEKTLEKELGSELYQAYKQVKNLSEAQGVQAHLPFQLNIK